MISMISDIGNKRSLNEDYAGYLEKENYKIYVVADGMGGHNAGEVASKMAVEAIVSYISENINNKNYNEILKKAIKTANNAIYDFASTSEKLNGMGTTVTACLVINNKGFVANVGDSSCFLIRNNKIKKITKDHSLVQELLDLGTISEEEAFNHPKKNIITRAVGTSKKILIDVFEIDILKDDIIMLCSDGLTNEIQKNEVLEILNSAKSLKNACEKLVLEAKNNGGRDNITVLLFGGDE
ncbi:Stp1/IreP family PP2C-type Ser/Thr phosphatase [Clostridium sp. HCP1S3_B4]|uniref:Stp1/IreP family PP2C-type Ser/Thr phosphatase n=1 Tax=unclassified Clostridium TaxID=2614128 RepID=UPI0016AE52D1|nr:Stp1/IreP family PP2C-type Ser/Thr phosphatase [Clostridiales bacterium]MDY2730605.1 Stp1/IreP family PP2C-type Ser/Thr phosphatase [Clostridium sp.]NLK23348.1 Stp1/IreP family PP2C-type Ser/Thr phosphatase [Clostridiales bacterium]